MEYLASQSIHFSVWSSDPQLTTSNVTVRAHSKCTVDRLTQYLHFCIREKNPELAVLPGELSLDYRNQTLVGETLCQQIETNYHGVIRLRMERRSPAEPERNLDYDPASFLKTGLQVQVNVLSVQKIHRIMIEDVNLHSTISHLAKLALEQLNQYEQNDQKNICSIKEHRLEDIVALDVAGRSHAIYLSASTEDLTLSDLLGVDFVPVPNGYCPLLCKVRHGQLEDGISIEFVSEAKFTIQKMVVNADTTILEVKDFICSVYAHSLRITPEDIKLIYKGCILHERNGASNEPNKVLNFVTEHVGAKLHVHINHEYSEPGPGFWNELFYAPDRFEFMPKRNHLTDTASQPNPRNQDGSPQTASLADGTSTSFETFHISHNRSPVAPSPPTPTPTVSITNRPISTSNGKSVTRSFETFERISINNETYFVPSHQLEAEYYEMNIMGKTIRFSKNEIQLNGNHIQLNSNARAILENAIGEPIKYSSPLFNTRALPNRPAALHGEEVHANVDNENFEGRPHQPGPHVLAWINWRRIFSQQTVSYFIEFLLGRVSTLALILLEAYQILPFWGFCACVVIMTVRLLWINLSIGRKIRKLLIGSYDKIAPYEVSQIRNLIKSEKLSSTFFQKVTSPSSTVNEKLCEQLNKNQEMLNRLFLEVSDSFPEQEPGSVATRTVLDVFLSTTQHGDHSITRELFQETLDETSLLLTQDLKDLPDWAAPLISELRRYNLQFNKKHMSKTLYYKLWLDIHKPWNYFKDTTIMRHIVPNPRTDNVFLSILKNCILFFLLFLPTFERQFEEIIEERLIQQSREE